MYNVIEEICLYWAYSYLGWIKQDNLKEKIKSSRLDTCNLNCLKFYLLQLQVSDKKSLTAGGIDPATQQSKRTPRYNKATHLRLSFDVLKKVWLY